jgi:hypothetical protein
MSQASKTGHMDISDASSIQAVWKRIMVELGVVPRARYGADIYNLCNTVDAEQMNKIVEEPC